MYANSKPICPWQATLSLAKQTNRSLRRVQTGNTLGLISKGRKQMDSHSLASTLGPSKKQSLKHNDQCAWETDRGAGCVPEYGMSLQRLQ